MKAKIITTAILSIIGITICSIAVSSYNPASALEYTANYGNSFTLRPSISVSLSSPDLIIDDLLPNTSSDSNEIIVNVESNNSTGYVLNSSVGSNTITGSNNTSYNNRNLTNTSSNSYIFTSLDYGSSIPDMSSENVDPNTWGYSYATTSTTNVETGSNEWNWSNYSGLPLYSDTTNIATLKSSNTPSSASGDNIGFKIAAKASITQGSGEYTNIINFIAVGNPTPTSFYDAFATAASQPGSTITQLNGYYKMQDMTADICDAVDLYDDNSHIQLIDTRDNEVYWIGKLKDNRCWLLDNLRLDPTAVPLSVLQGNTNASDEILVYLKNGGGLSPYAAMGASTIWNNATDNWTVPRVNVAYKNTVSDNSYDQSGQWKIGAYYNYCAASAGSYCYIRDAGENDSSYDICPTHWRMPTSGTNGEYYNLHNSKYISYADFRNALHIPLSGRIEWHNANVIYQSEIGNFWSSTYHDSSNMMRLMVDASSSIGTTYTYWRSSGMSVRCIANNE